MATYATQKFGSHVTDMQNDVLGRSVAMKRVQCIGMQIYDEFDTYNANNALVEVNEGNINSAAPGRWEGTDDMAKKSCKLVNQIRATNGFPTDGQKLTLHAAHFFDEARRNKLSFGDETDATSADATSDATSADATSADATSAVYTPLSDGDTPAAKVIHVLEATKAEQHDRHTIIPLTVDIAAPGSDDFRLFTVPRLGAGPANQLREIRAHARSSGATGNLSIGGYEAEKQLCRIIKRAYTDEDAASVQELYDQRYDCTREEVSVTGALWNASRIYHDTKFLQNVADKGRSRFATWFDETGQSVDSSTGTYYASREVTTVDQHRAKLQDYYNELRGGSRLLRTDVAEHKLINQGKLREKMACAMTYTVKNAVDSAKVSSVGPEIAEMAHYVNSVVCADPLGGILA